MNDRTTEEQFLAEHNTALKEDLKQARNEIATLSKQITDGQSEQEKLAFKNDFLVNETVRLMASREQYERVAIRATALLDGALTALMATLQQMQDEIRDAAFTKVPGSAKPIQQEPASSVNVEKIAETFAAGFDGAESAALPPPPRFGSGSKAA